MGPITQRDLGSRAQQLLGNIGAFLADPTSDMTLDAIANIMDYYRQEWEELYGNK